MGAGTPAILGEHEIARYREDGLIVPRYRLPEDVLARIQGSVRAVVAANAAKPSDVMVGIEDENGGHEVAGNKRFLDYAAHPQLLDLVEQLIGPDLILWDCALILKPPGIGKAIRWHQDSPYIHKIKPLVNLAIWISIDGASPENGGMSFIPGSHKGGMVRHVRLEHDGLPGFEDEVDPALVDESRARPVVLEPGQLCVFDVHTIHGSPENRSSRARTGLIFRWMPGTSVYDDTVAPYTDAKGVPVDPPNRPIYLMRGRDQTGRNRLTPLPGHA